MVTTTSTDYPLPPWGGLRVEERSMVQDRTTDIVQRLKTLGLSLAEVKEL